MSIPAVTKFRIPILNLLGDGREQKLSYATNALADQFQLAPEERPIRISSGNPVVGLRTSWAGFHLRKAGLVRDGQKGILCLTDDVKNCWRHRRRHHRTPSSGIISRSYCDWKESTAKNKLPEKPTSGEDEMEDEVSPEEPIKAVELKLKSKLATELQEHLGIMDPYRFEQLIPFPRNKLIKKLGGIRLEDGWKKIETGLPRSGARDRRVISERERWTAEEPFAGAQTGCPRGG